MKHLFSHIAKTLLSLLLAAVLLASCEMPLPPAPQPSGKLTVHFLDVGQGDAIFVELPNGQTMLVDAGEKTCGKGVADYIRRKGYTKLDYLVATHPHLDHIGGMAYLVQRFEIGKVCMTEATATTAPFEDLLLAIRRKELPVVNAQAGLNLLTEGDCAADILAPAVLDEENLNNCSIVLRLRCGERSFLLTGDAELAETAAVTADLHADVLKLPHHGSSDAFDEALLQRVSPSFAVISCGEGNDYGHPHRETLALLEQADVTVYRTDKNHTTVITTDGQDLSVTDNRPGIERG